MCLLIVMRGLHSDFPVVVAGNRDERIDRKASPPGLWVGDRVRMLSPRDRQADGTWLAVDEHGRFAGISNLAGEPSVPGSPSRGALPPLALDQADLDAAVAAVTARVHEHAHAAFQLVLCDGTRTVVLRQARGEVRVIDWCEPVLVVSNEHEPGQLRLRGLSAAAAPGLLLSARLEALALLLRDRGGNGHHEVCKHGAERGTVSSSLVAVPRGDLAKLVWLYAPGPPDVTAYRNYGNLGRRLLPEEPMP